LSRLAQDYVRLTTCKFRLPLHLRLRLRSVCVLVWTTQGDELFGWMATVISSLHAHHPATACGVVEQLAGRWGVDAAAAAAAAGGGQGCAAAAALQSLVGLLHSTVSAIGTGEATEATVAALAAAEQCLCMCPTLIDPSCYQNLLVGCAAACSAAEVSTLGGGLRFLGGLQQHAEQPAGAAGGGGATALSAGTALGQALGAVAGPVGEALAHQLQGHCDDALVDSVARTLHWLLSTECVLLHLRPSLPPSLPAPPAHAKRARTRTCTPTRVRRLHSNSLTDGGVFGRHGQVVGGAAACCLSAASELPFSSGGAIASQDEFIAWAEDLWQRKK
jgi:hypothetical protein